MVQTQILSKVYSLPYKNDFTDDMGRDVLKEDLLRPVLWIEISRFGDDEIRGRRWSCVDNKLAPQARLLAFPRPKTQSCDRSPPTDNRYAITTKNNRNFFRGVFPISYDVGLRY